MRVVFPTKMSRLLDMANNARRASTKGSPIRSCPAIAWEGQTAGCRESKGEAALFILWISALQGIPAMSVGVTPIYPCPTLAPQHSQCSCLHCLLPMPDPSPALIHLTYIPVPPPSNPIQSSFFLPTHCPRGSPMEGSGGRIHGMNIYGGRAVGGGGISTLCRDDHWKKNQKPTSSFKKTLSTCVLSLRRQNTLHILRSTGIEEPDFRVLFFYVASLPSPFLPPTLPGTFKENR